MSHASLFVQNVMNKNWNMIKVVFEFHNMPFFLKQYVYKFLCLLERSRIMIIITSITSLLCEMWLKSLANSCTLVSCGFSASTICQQLSVLLQRLWPFFIMAWSHIIHVILSHKCMTKHCYIFVGQIIKWCQRSRVKVSQIPFQSSLLISQIWNVALTAFWGTLWGKILVAHITFTFCSFHCWCSVRSIEIEEVIPKGGVYVQSDGEHLGFLPTECSVLPAAINIFSWHWALLSSSWIK